MINNSDNNFKMLIDLHQTFDQFIMFADCVIDVVGDESNINACQEQKRCGKCISLSPDCHWCLQKVSKLEV